MNELNPIDAVGMVPPGRWAVGISGGADSVALLALLRQRADLRLHAVHLNHQLRGAASDGDAESVRSSCAAWNIPATIRTRQQIQAARPAANPSEHYRGLRLQLFSEVVAEHDLQGVLLAHHRDDQAETIFQRLVRGSGYRGLCGMQTRSSVRGLTIVRPLLGVPGSKLRQFLTAQRICWREDASNRSDDYARNRARKLLAGRSELIAQLLDLGQRCTALRAWASQHALVLREQFEIKALASQPTILAEESARVWLAARGMPADRIDSNTTGALIAMASDAASPARIDLAGGIRLRRSRKIISVSAK